MNTIYRLLTILLIPLFLIQCWTYTVGISAVYAEEKVSSYPPETVESEPIDISKPAKESGGFKWWYILIGAAVVGGIAAAAGGGGSSSGGGGGSGGGESGSLTVGW